MGGKWKLLFPYSSSTKEERLPAKTFESQMTESNTVGPESPFPEPLMNRDLAALKLQKTYKSFRTRRQLADCAVLVEHRWWKLLDFVVLKCSSVSFFEIEKPETAVSRWSRARTRAAKVGMAQSIRHVAKKMQQHLLLKIPMKMLIETMGKNFVIKYEGSFESGNSHCLVLEHVAHDRPEASEIRFELRGGAWKEAFMQMDGEPWKQPMNNGE